MPDDPDKAWTQDYFLDRLEKETGWHLHRPSYSKYENGKSIPRPATLRKLIAFWARHGEPGPDLAPPPPTPTPAGIPELVAALAAQTTAINALVERLGSLADDSIASAVRQAVAEAGLIQGDGDSPGAQPPGPSL